MRRMLSFLLGLRYGALKGWVWLEKRGGLRTESRGTLPFTALADEEEPAKRLRRSQRGRKRTQRGVPEGKQRGTSRRECLTR